MCRLSSVDMIKVYSIPNCTYCGYAKNYLKENSIQFVDINIKERHRREERQLCRTVNKGLVPVLVDGSNVFSNYNHNSKDEFINDLQIWLKKIKK